MKPSRLASPALVATVPNAIGSNAFWMSGRRSVLSAVTPSTARAIISLVPPPAGIRPTPTSTRPM